MRGEALQPGFQDLQRGRNATTATSVQNLLHLLLGGCASQEGQRSPGRGMRKVIGEGAGSPFQAAGRASSAATAATRGLGCGWKCGRSSGSNWSDAGATERVVAACWRSTQGVPLALPASPLRPSAALVRQLSATPVSVTGVMAALRMWLAARRDVAVNGLTSYR